MKRFLLLFGGRLRRYGRPPVVMAAALVLTVSLGSAASGVTATQPDIATRLAALKSNGKVPVVEVGRSVEGRPIEAFIITHARGKALDDCVRILVISGQHGNEHISIEAAVELMEDLVQRRVQLPKRALENVALVFVPVANPDGLAANKRCNAAGVDLNRNWDAPDQPETIAVTRLARRLRPDVLIDLHQWTDEDHNRPNCVEAAGFDGCPETRLAQMLAAAVTPGTPLQFVPYSIDSNPRLAHRHFTGGGTCGLLVETANGWPEKQRIASYKTVIESAISLLDSGLPGVRQALLATRSRQPAPNTWLAAACAPRPARPSIPRPGPTGIWLTVAGVLLAWAPRLGRSRRAPVAIDDGLTQPLRAFTMSELIQSDLPARDKLAIMHRCRRRPTDRLRAFKGGQ